MGAAACALTRFAWRRVMSRAPSLQLSADADVMLAAVRCDASFLKYAATALRADREFILAAVQQDASCLRYASVELRADREVVLAAVKKDRHALEFAAPALLKAERKLVSAAVHQDTTYLKYAPLRADVYVILDAMQMRRREREDLKEQADDLHRRRAVEESRRELLQRAPREQHPTIIAHFKAADAEDEQEKKKESWAHHEAWVNANRTPLERERHWRTPLEISHDKDQSTTRACPPSPKLTALQSSVRALSRPSAARALL